MRKIILSAFIIFALSSFSNAQEPSWLTPIKQIEPLKSTEKEVERIFGKPTDRYADVGEHENDFGRLSVTYSEGRCSENKDAEYDVEKGTVVELDFFVTNLIKFKSLNINISGFKKEYASGVLDTFFYKHEALGMMYEISNGRLNSIYITPSENYASLACPKNPTQPEPITNLDKSK